MISLIYHLIIIINLFATRDLLIFAIQVDEGSPLIGLLAVLAMCLLASLASIYNEKVFKAAKNNDDNSSTSTSSHSSNGSIWLSNIRFCAISIFFNVLIILVIN
jgi:hypothetical protein